MHFIGILKASGKKTPKRWGNKRLALHGMVFKYMKRMRLTDEFINETGLSEPEIRDAVKSSLYENWGLVVKAYGADNIVQKPKQTTKKKASIL